MRLHHRVPQLASAALAAALLLAACGGDDGDDTSATTGTATDADDASSGDETTDGEDGAAASGDDRSAADASDADADGDADAEGAETDGASSDSDSDGTDGDADATASDGTVDGELQAVFADYRQALLDRDGEAAALLVSPNTIAWYDTLLQLGLEADAEVLENEAPLADAISVVPLRAEFGEELTTLADGRALFVEGVELGLTGDDLTSVEIQSFTDAGDGTATGVVQGKPLFSFSQGGDGAWTLDLEATTTAIFSQLPEEDFVAGLTGGQGATRRDLFVIVARDVYATTWEELSQPIG